MIFHPVTVTIMNKINWKTYNCWAFFLNNNFKSKATNDHENYLKLFPRGIMKDNCHFIKYKHISKSNIDQLYDDYTNIEERKLINIIESQNQSSST